MWILFVTLMAVTPSGKPSPITQHQYSTHAACVAAAKEVASRHTQYATVCLAPSK